MRAAVTPMTPRLITLLQTSFDPASSVSGTQPSPGPVFELAWSLSIDANRNFSDIMELELIKLKLIVDRVG
jgi:hypothetical protein